MRASTLIPEREELEASHFPRKATVLCFFFFGDFIPKELVELWMSSGSKQIIGQVEMIPVVLAKRVWREMLKEGRNLFFIDNESASECFVRYTPQTCSRGRSFSCL